MNMKSSVAILICFAFFGLTKADAPCGPDGTGSGYFADMNNCIKYYHCFEGNVEEYLTCGIQNERQLLYDPGHTWCDFPENVDCGDRPICDQNDENCHDQDDGEHNVCEGHPDGVHADETNCIKYYNCFNGNGARETCPTANGKQELFDETNKYCDYPDRVNCGDRPICDENDENCH